MDSVIITVGILVILFLLSTKSLYYFFDYYKRLNEFDGTVNILRKFRFKDLFKKEDSIHIFQVIKDYKTRHRTSDTRKTALLYKVIKNKFANNIIFMVEHFDANQLYKDEYYYLLEEKANSVKKYTYYDFEVMIKLLAIFILYFLLFNTMYAFLYLCVLLILILVAIEMYISSTRDYGNYPDLATIHYFIKYKIFSFIKSKKKIEDNPLQHINLVSYVNTKSIRLLNSIHSEHNHSDYDLFNKSLKKLSLIQIVIDKVYIEIEDIDNTKDKKEKAHLSHLASSLMKNEIIELGNYFEDIFDSMTHSELQENMEKILKVPSTLTVSLNECYKEYLRLKTEYFKEDIQEKEEDSFEHSLTSLRKEDSKANLKKWNL